MVCITIVSVITTPESGNYISQDPIGLLSGEPNFYAYVEDPNSWVDVFGLAPVTNTVDFTGYPDLYQGAGKNIVTIKLTGDRSSDFTRAFNEAGISKTDAVGYTWHHAADFDPKTGTSSMQLVKTPTHEASLPHKGSAGQFQDHFGGKYDTYEAKVKAFEQGWRDEPKKRAPKKRDVINLIKKTIMFSKKSQPITQADINFLERVVGYSLPIDFITQYLSSNGGVSDKNYFYVEEDEGYVEVSFFLPVKYPSSSLGDMSIETSYENLISKGVPTTYIPFAVDWGGNYFSIDLKTNDVVLLLMDLGEFTKDSIKYLTTGFLNFLNNLEEEGD